jgi:hypothetical protein
MRKLLIALFCLLSVPALAQSVKQSGKVTPGRPVMRTINGTIQGAIDPRSYGVACDGITNDSPAWATLIAAVPNYSNIILPTGCTSLLGGNPGIDLSGKAGLHFVGAQAFSQGGGATLRYTGALDGTAIYCSPCANIYFEGFTLDLNAQAARGFQAVWGAVGPNMGTVWFNRMLMHAAQTTSPARPNVIMVGWCDTGPTDNCEALHVTNSQIYCYGGNNTQNGIGVLIGHTNAVNNEVSNNFINYCQNSAVEMKGTTRASNNVLGGNGIDFNCLSGEPIEISNNRSEDHIYFFQGACPFHMRDNKIGSTTQPTVPSCRINITGGNSIALVTNNQMVNYDTVPAFCGTTGGLVSIGNGYDAATFDANGRFVNYVANNEPYTSISDFNYGPGAAPLTMLRSPGTVHAEDLTPFDGVKTALIGQIVGAPATSLGSSGVLGLVDQGTNGASIRGACTNSCGGPGVAMIEADMTNVHNPTLAYGLKVDTPNGANTAYGVYVSKINGSGVTTPWGVYQTDIGDPNLFAGPVINKPTTVALLPACTSSLDGARMWVTDQNTAVSYRGAVTGAGSTHQAVVCNGATLAWIQD